MHRHGEIGWQVGRVLLVGLCLFAFQLVFATMTGSIALFSDTVHVGGDMLALLLVIAAQLVAYQLDKLRGYETQSDYHNIELIVTAVNGVILIIAGVVLTLEAMSRLGNPPTVSGIIVIPGVVGIAGNSLMFLLLLSERHHLTVQSAASHVVFDIAASAGVITAGLLILFTGEKLVDPIISFGITTLIIGWGVRLVLVPIFSFNSHNHATSS